MAGGTRRPSGPRSKKRPAQRTRGTERYKAVIEILDAAEDNVTIEIDGESLTLTGFDKLLWPANERMKLPSYTRRDYLRHLLRVGPYMLPHLIDRPLTLIRMPAGITGRRFVHFHYEQRLPSFVDTIMIFSAKNARAEEFLLCNNMATVLWLAHIGTLELHVWHSRANTGPDAEGASTDYASSAASVQKSILNFPDYLVFDLDPYIYSGAEPRGGQPEFNVAAFDKARQVAYWLKDLLATMKLKTFVKTSGKTGLHVLVPIVRRIDYDGARAFAGEIARHLVRLHPAEITTEWHTTSRTGKVFMDYKMNQRVKTLNVPYSVRAVPGAPVSMPLTWKELERAQPLDYTMDNVPALLAKKGDIWRDILEAKQDLAKALT